MNKFRHRCRIKILMLPTSWVHRNVCFVICVLRFTRRTGSIMQRISMVLILHRVMCLVNRWWRDRARLMILPIWVILLWCWMMMSCLRITMMRWFLWWWRESSQIHVMDLESCRMVYPFTCGVGCPTIIFSCRTCGNFK